MANTLAEKYQQKTAEAYARANNALAKPRANAQYQGFRGSAADNFIRSAIAGTAGYAGDVASMGTMAWQAGMNRPVVGQNFMKTTEDFAQDTGADLSRPSGILGQIGSPDLMDLMRLGGAKWAMTLFHGTPHKFDAFDMGKIGTGEGAQSYGHGLYFAQNKGAAESYQRGLSDWAPNGQALDPGSIEDRAAAFVAESIDSQSHHPIPRAIQRIKSDTTLRQEDRDAMLQAIGRWSQDGVEWKRGHLYEVDIHDETIDKMLDWDLLTDSDIEKLSKTDWWKYAEDSIEGRAMRSGKNPSGGDVVRWLQEDYTPEEASQILKEAGFPGIRFLDGGSRSAGEGTRNIVLFDTNVINKIKRDGEEVFNRIGR